MMEGSPGSVAAMRLSLASKSRLWNSLEEQANAANARSAKRSSSSPLLSTIDPRQAVRPPSPLPPESPMSAWKSRDSPNGGYYPAPCWLRGRFQSTAPGIVGRRVDPKRNVESVNVCWQGIHDKHERNSGLRGNTLQVPAKSMRWLSQEASQNPANYPSLKVTHTALV
mmetsp:Transcript_110281/g.235540  ORF Transcript_110281/g.235540 Transcript_110281/m.235540 type:complete len:168 (-) Transcript_110281:124-627(-)